MDPRVTTPGESLAQQFELETRICQGMHQSYQAREQVRNLRAQLKALKERAGQAGLAEAIAALDQKAAALEGAAEGFFGGGGAEGAAAESLARANMELGGLLRVVDSTDAAPTAAQLAAFDELEQALRKQLALWGELKSRDVAAINAQLKQANLPAVSLEPAPAPSR